jgi:anti-sigma B factor antagonist
MGNISFHLEVITLPNSSTCILGKFTGLVDASTNVEFEDVFKKLVDTDNQTQLIINLSGVTYISSTGLGILIRYVQRCRENGGDIKLSQVPPGIWTIFKTVGLDNIFEILNSDQQALRSFQDQASYKSIVKHKYPAKFKCPSCDASLEIAQPGKYRCNYCATIFSADETGAVKGFIPRRPKVIETKILDEPDGLEWVKGLIRFQAQWLKFTEEDIKKIEEAMEKTYQFLVNNVAKLDVSNYRLLAVTGKKELSFGFVIMGDSKMNKEDIKNHSDMQVIQKLVDKLDITTILPKGLIVKLTKAQK